MEMHMFVALILYKYEFTLLDPLPSPVSMNLPADLKCHLEIMNFNVRVLSAALFVSSLITLLFQP